MDKCAHTHTHTHKSKHMHVTDITHTQWLHRSEVANIYAERKAHMWLLSWGCCINNRAPPGSTQLLLCIPWKSQSALIRYTASNPSLPSQITKEHQYHWQWSKQHLFHHEVGGKEEGDHDNINPEVFGQEPPSVPDDHYGGGGHSIQI